MMWHLLAIERRFDGLAISLGTWYPVAARWDLCGRRSGSVPWCQP